MRGEGSVTKFCESMRGEYGRPCPDCGVTLPSRPRPLGSWKAARATDQGASERGRLAAPAAFWVKGPGPRRLSDTTTRVSKGAAYEGRWSARGGA